MIVPCEMSETPMAETTATAGTPSSAGVPALSVENTAKAQIAKDTDVIVQRLTEAEQGLRFTDLKSLTGLSKQRLTAALAHCGTAGRARKGEGHLGEADLSTNWGRQSLGLLRRRERRTSGLTAPPPSLPRSYAAIGL